MYTTPSISIIIPVYKTEKYIRRCLDSVIYQTFTNFEVILIDDGSPDNAGSICDEYAQKDNRFIVYHKPNEGIAATRQYGVEQIKGYYTLQIDSDDWIESNMLEEMYSKAIQDDADIVICDYFVNYNKYEQYRSADPKSCYYQDVLKNLIYRSQGYVWNKMIRSSCYHMPETINWISGQNLFEDMIICSEILKNPRSISYIPKAFYHYWQTPNSYLHSAKLYHQYTKLNTIMENILDSSIYHKELLYLKKIEAYHALDEHIFSKSEYIARYNFLKETTYQWFGEKSVNRALNGFYYSTIWYIRFMEWCKKNIKKIILR